MGQLQFRSDDTVKWQEGYGDFSEGDATPSGTDTNPATTFSGAIETKTGNLGDATGFEIGDIVYIHQSREGGEGAGNHQLNKILGKVGNVLTFKYDLMHNYDGKAQIVRVKQNRDVVIDGTLNANAWDGSKYGIIVLMGRRLSGVGSIILSERGYRGGNLGNNSNNYGDGATTGEGTLGDKVAGQHSPNGNGGGSGATNLEAPGGGGNATVGGGTVGGAEAGNAQLTLIVFGGGSGGRGQDNPLAGNVGRKGGAILVLIFEEIDLSAMTIVEAQGEDAVSPNPSSGAGGSILIKGKRVNLGTSKINAEAGTGSTERGSTGRIHVDYSESVAGTTTPTADTRRDLSLNNQSAGFMALL